MAPVIVQGKLAVATAILESATLGFLGIGAQPPDPEWGKILADSKTTCSLLHSPGIAIMLTVFGFNLMRDGLRDAMDPKMKS